MASTTLSSHLRFARSRGRWLRWVAILVWVALLAILAVSLVVYAGRGMPRQPIAFAEGPLGMTAVALTAVVYATVGAFLAARMPRNPIAWVFIAIGFGMTLIIPVNLALAESLRAFRPVPDAGLVIVWAITSIHLPASGALLVVVLLLFPHGRPEWRHWRAPASLALVGCALMATASALRPDGLLWYPTLPNPAAAPHETEDLLAAMSVAGMVCLVAGLLIAAAWLVRRYRHADPRRHRQLGWVMVGALAMTVTLAPLFAVRYALGATNATGEVLVFMAAAGGVLFPATVALACLKEHLFGVRAIISRTLVYVPLMAVLGGAYAASVIVLQRLFIAFTGNASDVAFILATLLVAAVLTPVRRTLEGAVERLMKRPALAHASAVHATAPGHHPDEVLLARIERLEATLTALRGAGDADPAARPAEGTHPRAQDPAAGRAAPVDGATTPGVL